MLKEVLPIVKDECSNQLHIQSEYYKGELEEDAEWNPVFPIIFVRPVSSQPLDTNGEDGKVLSEEIKTQLMCGVKDVDVESVFDLLDDVRGLFDGKIINNDSAGVSVRTRYEGFQFGGYSSGVVFYVVNVMVTAYLH